MPKALYIIVIFITICRALSVAAPLIQPSAISIKLDWYDQDGSKEDSEAEKIKYESKEDNWFAQIELPAYELLSLKFVFLPNSQLLENSLKLFCPPPNFA